MVVSGATRRNARSVFRYRRKSVIPMCLVVIYVSVPRWRVVPDPRTELSRSASSREPVRSPSEGYVRFTLWRFQETLLLVDVVHSPPQCHFRGAREVRLRERQSAVLPYIGETRNEKAVKRARRVILCVTSRSAVDRHGGFVWCWLLFNGSRIIICRVASPSVEETRWRRAVDDRCCDNERYSFRSKFSACHSVIPVTLSPSEVSSKPANPVKCRTVEGVELPEHRMRGSFWPPLGKPLKPNFIFTSRYGDIRVVSRGHTLSTSVERGTNLIARRLSVPAIVTVELEMSIYYTLGYNFMFC